MAELVSPVVPGLEAYEIVLGKDQPDVVPLPCLRGCKPYYTITARWKLNDEERTMIAAGADIFVAQQTFGALYQPIGLSVTPVPGTLILQEHLDRLIVDLGLDEELNERLRSHFS